MSITLKLDGIAEPELDEDDTSGDRKECIFCPCKPAFSFCGKYVPGVTLSPRVWYIDDDYICEDCRAVAKSWHCPYCRESFRDSSK